MGYVRILLAHLKPVPEILAVKTGECVNVCTYWKVGFVPKCRHRKKGALACMRARCGAIARNKGVRGTGGARTSKKMASLEDRRNLRTYVRTYVRTLNISEGHGWRRCQLGNNNLKGSQVIVDGGASRQNNFRDAVAQ